MLGLKLNHVIKRGHGNTLDYISSGMCALITGACFAREMHLLTNACHKRRHMMIQWHRILHKISVKTISIIKIAAAQ